MKECSVCGSTEETARILKYSKDEKLYCFKHYQHMTRHGKIIHSIYEKNKIRVDGSLCFVELTGVKGDIKGEAIIDLEDYEKISSLKWYAKPNQNNIYVYSKKAGKTILLHRFLLDVSDSKIYVDHKDGNGLNNCKENLRKATNQQNSFNCQHRVSKNPDKVVGVIFEKRRNKWLAQIQHDNKNIFLGYFEDRNDAIRHRLTKEAELFKDFSPQKHLFEQYNISQ